MESIKTLGSGEKLTTPSVRQMLLDDLYEEVEKNDHNELKEGKKQVMGYPCRVCKSSGIDPEMACPCLACEGTGNDYEIHYGIQDGKMYAYIRQYGLETFKEYCKACRESEAELSTSQRANKSMIRPYALPAAIEMELLARGYDRRELQSGDNVRKVAKIVQTEWPYLMTTNLRF